MKVIEESENVFKLWNHGYDMEKRFLGIILVIVVLFSMFVLAQDNESEGEVSNLDGIEKGYACLEKQIDVKGGFSLQEAVFGVLALGREKKLLDVIDEEKNTREECWPRNGCKVKDTAQVMLAYERIGRDVSGIKDWLLSKEIDAKDLVWYLEVDITNHDASECSLNVDGRSSNFKVNDDMTLTGNVGSCFDISFGGFWLKFRDRCLDQDVEVSCDKDFITALVYQKKSGGTVFVSSNTESGVSGGTTSAKINSKCFADSSRGSCDYEGTLWATVALSRADVETRPFIPYLLALADINQKYLPNAFVYILTSGEDQYSNLIGQQKQGQYWDVVGSPYNRFYDTSVALLALTGSGSGEVGSSQDYLLDVQTKEGCWNNNNVRDTGFVLWSAWPRTVGGGDPIGGGESLCIEIGNHCELFNDCLSAGGEILDNFACPNFRDVCCSVAVFDASCNEKGGIVCSANQDCDGSVEPSGDGSCCVRGACIDRQPINECAIIGGKCFPSCTAEETESNSKCPTLGEICCVDSGEIPEPPSEGIPWWVWLLVVLIILVVVAIIFRGKIQMWMHRNRRGRGKPGGRPPARRPPGMPPGGMIARSGPRYGVPGARQPSSSGPALRKSTGSKSPKDKELEETMRKLKEMSK
jgi:hypothetical protein